MQYCSCLLQWDWKVTVSERFYWLCLNYTVCMWVFQLCVINYMLKSWFGAWFSLYILLLTNTNLQLHIVRKSSMILLPLSSVFQEQFSFQECLARNFISYSKKFLKCSSSHNKFYNKIGMRNMNPIIFSIYLITYHH